MTWTKEAALEPSGSTWSPGYPPALPDTRHRGVNSFSCELSGSEGSSPVLYSPWRHSVDGHCRPMVLNLSCSKEGEDS